MDIDILMDDAHEYLAAADKAKVRNTKISPLQEYTALTAATTLFISVLENCDLLDEDKAKIQDICHQSLYRKNCLESKLLHEDKNFEKPLAKPKDPDQAEQIQSCDSTAQQSSLPKKEELLSDPKSNLHQKLCGDKKIFEYLKKILLGNQVQRNYRPNWTEVMPKSVLLAGVPGNGKTLIIEALASYLGFKVIKVTSALLKDKFHGNSEKMVVHVFKTAIECNDCFILFDEIDLMLRKRGEEQMQSVDDGIFNCFNLMMNELESLDTKVVVFAATNKPKHIDAAVTKRFYIRFVIGNPEAHERLDMIKAQLDPCALKDDQLEQLADLTDGLSFCAIKQIIGELYLSNYLKDLQSTSYKKSETSDEYHACSSSDKDAKDYNIATLPRHSLRARPLEFDVLKKRFSKTKKNSSLSGMSKELKSFHEEYGTKEFA